MLIKKYKYFIALIVIVIVVMGIILITNKQTLETINIQEKLQDDSFMYNLRSINSSITIGDTTKDYSTEERKIIITDDKTKESLELKLLSNYKQHASSGIEKRVAEFSLMDFGSSLNTLFDNIESYNIKDGMKPQSKQFKLKYRTDYIGEISYIIDDWSNETNMSYGNKTVYYNVSMTNWTEFTSLDDIPYKNITIGLFTDTTYGEEVEWVITIGDFKILEWASYLVDDMIAYYDMENSSLVDRTGITGDGTENGAPTYVDGGLNGNNYFGDNIADSAQISAINSGGEVWSVSAWFRNDGYACTGSGENIAMIWDSFSSKSRSYIRCDADTGDGFEAGYANVDFTFASWEAYNDNTWHHIVQVANGTEGYVYLDGSNVGNFTITSNGFNTTTAIGGNRVNPHNHWRGDIDEVAFWSIALNGSGVLDLWNAGAGIFYPFEEVSIVLNITDPTTASVVDVNNGDNISIDFIIQQDGINITTGVTLENVTIDGNISNAIEFCEGINSSCSTHVNQTYCEITSCTWSIGTGIETIQSFFIGNGGTSNNVFEDLSDTAGSGASNWDSTASGEIRTFVRQYGSETIITTSSVDVGIWCDKDGAQGGDMVKIDAEFFDCGSSSTCASSPVSICAIASIDCDNGQAGATYETGSCTPATNTTIEAGHYVGFKLVTNTNKNPNPILYYNDTTTPSHINYTIDGGASSCTGISQSCSTFNNSACGIFDAGCNIDNTMFVNGLFWQTNVTVPENSGGLKDLFLNATYSSITYNNTQANSVNYSGAVGDTCTYTSGDWVVDCSDDCSISSPVDVGGNDILISGTGTFFTSANISNYGRIRIEGTDSSNLCRVRCDGGCFVG